MAGGEKVVVPGEGEASTSGAESSGQQVAAGGSGGQPEVPIVVRARELASVMNRARGPILERIAGRVPKFSGDGTHDVSDWLASYERYCGLEEIGPTELLLYMLDGGATRLYSRMIGWRSLGEVGSDLVGLDL